MDSQHQQPLKQLIPKVDDHVKTLRAIRFLVVLSEDTISELNLVAVFIEMAEDQKSYLQGPEQTPNDRECSLYFLVAPARVEAEVGLGEFDGEVWIVVVFYFGSLDGWIGIDSVDKESHL